MKRKTKAKPFTEMTTDELAEATAEFDKEFIADTFRPLTPEERREWQRIKRKVGRPRRGAGAMVISVSIERGLLARSDRLARKLGLSRAALVARGLETLVAADSKR